MTPQERALADLRLLASPSRVRLLELARGKGASIVRLAEELRLTATTTSNHVQKLAGRGLVEIVPAKDRRLHQVRTVDAAVLRVIEAGIRALTPWLLWPGLEETMSDWNGRKHDQAPGK